MSKEMQASIERLALSRIDPDVQGFEGEAFDEFARCMAEASGQKGRRVTFRRGIAEDGTPQLWWKVEANNVTIGEGDTSFNCPPLPLSECE